MRMMENLPGITAGVLFNAGRGSRTMLAGGGFMDDRRFLRGRAAKYGGFAKGASAPTLNNRAFTRFGRRRGVTTAAGAMRDPFMYGARVNNLTMRPRALRRFSSLSVFSAAESGTYSYAGGIRALGKMRFGPLEGLANRVGAAEGQSILAPGLFSAIRAGGIADSLERKYAKGSARAGKRLTKIDQTITRLAGMNNPGLITPTVPMKSAADAALASGNIGVRGNLLVSSLGGQGTQFMGGYVRGAMGYAKAGGLSEFAQKGANRAVTATQMALKEMGNIAKGTTFKAGSIAAQEVLEKGLFKSLGFKGTMQFASSKYGSKVAIARGASGALRVASPIGTAMLVYDLAKMGGEIIKSGINLARDAEKSLQGSFSKPTFGMGYRDTEAAATSRSRGVMAIQNSRLNARSALGNEGAMLAAHFG
jgi:hypothetical protein